MNKLIGDQELHTVQEIQPSETVVITGYNTDSHSEWEDTSLCTSGFHPLPLSHLGKPTKQSLQTKHFWWANKIITLCVTYINLDPQLICLTISIFKESTSTLRNPFITFSPSDVYNISCFNEVKTNYVHLPWMEYIQHSNRFHLTLHFFLHRQSEEKEEAGGKEFFSKTMLPFPYRISHKLELMTKTRHLSSKSSSTDVSLTSFLDLFWGSDYSSLFFFSPNLKPTKWLFTTKFSTRRQPHSPPHHLSFHTSISAVLLQKSTKLPQLNTTLSSVKDVPLTIKKRKPNQPCKKQKMYIMHKIPKSK